MCCAASVTPAAVATTRTLDAIRRSNGSLADDIARVQSRRRLEQHDVHFVLSDGAMLDSTRDYQELAFFERDVAIAEFHREAALHDEKELVLAFVMMPDEFAEELHQLYVLAVELANDLRIPVSVHERQLFSEI